jgi:hypothetical protein
MKTLTIRKVPDTVYSGLAEWARENHRSLQEQVRHLLEEDVKLRSVSVMESAQAYRARIASRQLGNVVDDVKEDRNR